MPEPPSLSTLLAERPVNAAAIVQLLSSTLAAPPLPDSGQPHAQTVQTLSILHSTIGSGRETTVSDDDAVLSLCREISLDLFHLVLPLALSSHGGDDAKTMARSLLVDTVAAHGNAREVFVACMERFSMMDVGGVERENVTGMVDEFMVLVEVVSSVLPRIKTQKASDFVLEAISGLSKGWEILSWSLRQASAEAFPTPKIPDLVPDDAGADDPQDESQEPPPIPTSLPDQLYQSFLSFILSAWCLTDKSEEPRLTDITTDHGRCYYLLVYMYFRVLETVANLDLGLELTGDVRSGPPRPPSAAQSTSTSKTDPTPHDWTPRVNEIMDLALALRMSVTEVLLTTDPNCARYVRSVRSKAAEEASGGEEATPPRPLFESHPISPVGMGVFLCLLFERDSRRAKGSVSVKKPAGVTKGPPNPKLVDRKWMLGRAVEGVEALLGVGVRDESPHAAGYALSLLLSSYTALPAHCITTVTFSSPSPSFPGTSSPQRVLDRLVRTMVSTPSAGVRSAAFKVLAMVVGRWLEEDCRLYWIGEMLKMGGAGGGGGGESGVAMGLMGVAIAAVTIMKDEIVAAMGAPAPGVNAKGRPLRPPLFATPVLRRTLFPIVFDLGNPLYASSGMTVASRGAGGGTVLTDVDVFFEKHGLVMHVVHMLLYLLLRDGENKTQIWDESCLHDLEHDFLKPLGRRLQEVKAKVSSAREYRMQDLDVALMEDAVARVAGVLKSRERL